MRNAPLRRLGFVKISSGTLSAWIACTVLFLMGMYFAYGIIFHPYGEPKFFAYLVFLLVGPILLVWIAISLIIGHFQLRYQGRSRTELRLPAFLLVALLLGYLMAAGPLIPMGASLGYHTILSKFDDPRFAGDTENGDPVKWDLAIPLDRGMTEAAARKAFLNGKCRQFSFIRHRVSFLSRGSLGR